MDKGRGRLGSDIRLSGWQRRHRSHTVLGRGCHGGEVGNLATKTRKARSRAARAFKVLAPDRCHSARLAEIVTQDTYTFPLLQGGVGCLTATPTPNSLTLYTEPWNHLGSAYRNMYDEGPWQQWGVNLPLRGEFVIKFAQRIGPERSGQADQRKQSPGGCVAWYRESQEKQVFRFLTGEQWKAFDRRFPDGKPALFPTFPDPEQCVLKRPAFNLRPPTSLFAFDRRERQRTSDSGLRPDALWMPAKKKRAIPG